MATSPWEQALGSEFEGLHPRLQRYFARIPEGRRGRGEGVFDSVGSRRRGLALPLWLLARLQILWSGWGESVPFAVTNVPDGESIRATRRIVRNGRTRAMVDRIVERDGLIVDRVGRLGLIEVRFQPRGDEGRLLLRSTSVRIRLGPVAIPLPTLVAPVIELIESASDNGRRQHVSFRMDAPGLGCCYEYRGAFDYEIVEA